MFPCLLGIQTSVAYLLSSKILYSDFSRESWQRRSWSLITATLVTVGVIFCLTILQANTWWNKYGGEYTLSFTQIIHQPKNSLVLVNRQRPETIIFYNLEPEVKLLLITDETLKAYCFKGDDDVFFLNPSKNMQAELKLQHYGLEALAQFSDPDKVYDEPPQLWKLRRGNN